MTTPQTEQRELTAGRDLDALIAEKVFGAFGFEHIDVVNGTPNELFAVLPGNRAVNRVPYFSTDIAAAWEVLEHLEADPRRILSEITRKQSSFSTRFVYEVVLRQCTPPFPRHWWAEAVTAPEAICLAALKAVAV